MAGRGLELLNAYPLSSLPVTWRPTRRKSSCARRYGVDPAVLETRGHHAGSAKAAAVALASRLANLSGRLIGQHYGIGSAAIGAIHRRLADRPDALGIVESLTKQLRRKKIKYKA